MSQLFLELRAAGVPAVAEARGRVALAAPYKTKIGQWVVEPDGSTKWEGAEKKTEPLAKAKTDGKGRPVLDSEKKPVMIPVLDESGDPVMIPAKDPKGKPIWIPSPPTVPAPPPELLAKIAKVRADHEPKPPPPRPPSQQEILEALFDPVKRDALKARLGM